jgi:hypothetical protein
MVMERVPWEYVWDPQEKICFAVMGASRFRYGGLMVLAPVGVPREGLGMVGTQKDLEEQLKSQSWWNHNWPFPVLTEDPIPF